MTQMTDEVNRRSLLKFMGAASMTPAASSGLSVPELAFPAFALAGHPSGHIVHEVAAPGQDANVKPGQSIRFAVIGVDHNHILGMTAAVIRGGGQLVSFYGTTPKGIADFQRRYPDTKAAQSEDEILNDPSIQLVASAAIPDLRAPLGIRVMQHGKDYLADKPGITTLEQLADVRTAVAATKKMFAIMYSERLEVKAAVKAGELIQEGAIGKVVQTINIAPHKVTPASRPEWFWQKKRFGGILCDIGSHQADQFVYYTGSTTADVAASQVANVNHKDHPEFEDFGDMLMHGNGGFGYVRVDWFTPERLPVFGDGRLFVLGTEGYIELRKYIDIEGRTGGSHLFLVNGKETRYIDCNNVVLPFGPQFVGDILNRTHVAQNQEQALLATELVLKAQKNAKLLNI
jgi:predicted dehydrogenase